MTAPLDLAGIGRWVSRPGATPAPKPVTQPTPTGDNPLPSRIGPTVATNDRPTADIVADLWAAIARSRQARGASTDDLPEVAR